MTTTCTASEIRQNRSILSAIVDSRAVGAMAELFSAVLEKKVSNVGSLHILNAMVSFSGLLLLGWVSVAVAALMTSWFAISVYQCSKD